MGSGESQSTVYQESADTREISILSICKRSVLVAFIAVRNRSVWYVWEGNMYYCCMNCAQKAVTELQLLQKQAAK